MKPLAFALAASLVVAPSMAQTDDPFSKSAKQSDRSLVDIVPQVPGSFPPPQKAEVTKELAATPRTDLNLRCQGFLSALGQASQLRREVTGLMDVEKAMDRLQTALVNEAVAAADEDYSVKERLDLAKRTALGLVPKVKDQAVRFIRLLRKPSQADAQTLANQAAVCEALLKTVRE